MINDGIKPNAPPGRLWVLGPFPLSPLEHGLACHPTVLGPRLVLNQIPVSAGGSWVTRPAERWLPDQTAHLWGHPGTGAAGGMDLDSGSLVLAPSWRFQPNEIISGPGSLHLYNGEGASCPVGPLRVPCLDVTRRLYLDPRGFAVIARLAARHMPSAGLPLRSSHGPRGGSELADGELSPSQSLFPAPIDFYHLT